MSDGPQGKRAAPAGDPLLAGAELPAADIIRSQPILRRLVGWEFWSTWWLPVACLALAAGLVVTSVRGQGPRIVVHFADGRGLKAGDAVRYRGIDVGQVVEVRMNTATDGVDVHLQLAPESRRLAREGTRFWIERPRFSLTRVSGLDTVVGAKYVGLIPGPDAWRAVAEFEGLETPPVLQAAESEEITIRFLQGHGLAVGDPLKHRGIVVGEVTSVDLSDDLTSVVVRVQLLATSRPLARAGSQFWIERPTISLASTRGLETIVGGRYLAVVPGLADSPPQWAFDGLEVPAASDERPEGGLEIVLTGSERFGLEVGAPVSYRGLAIGYVMGVGLAPDATVVESRVYIQPAYKNLIRDNTRFWSTSGFDLGLGLTGLTLTAETLATIAAGGVSVATPHAPGVTVVTGHRFPLHEKAEAEWKAWQPRLALGNPAAPHLVPLPQPSRASLRWVEKRFGFSRQRERTGWVLPLDSGRLLGPADLLTIPESAVGQSATLEVAGQQMSLSSDAVEVRGDLAQAQPPTDWRPAEVRWPRDRLRVPGQPEDGVFSPGWHETSTVLAAAHLKPSDGFWLVDPTVPIPQDLHGAAVVSIADGRLIGLIVAEEGRARVALLAEGPQE